MIRYTQQAKRCICEQHSDTHPEHAKHLIAHRGDFRCPHWDWATDERYRVELQEKQHRREKKRRSSRPRVVAPIAA